MRRTDWPRLFSGVAVQIPIESVPSEASGCSVSARAQEAHHEARAVSSPPRIRPIERRGVRAGLSTRDGAASPHCCSVVGTVASVRVAGSCAAA